MTGIERLRDFAQHMKDFSVWPGGQKLLDIADQIERETQPKRDTAEDVSMSAYDLLPEEDREAIAWVRDNGGLDSVKREWRSCVPYDKHEQRRQRLLGQIAECETALGRRNQRIKELGRHINDLTRENAELRRRAMPDGMEWLVDAWPRFEDDAPVRFEDEWCPRTGGTTKVGQVVLAVDGSFALNASWYEPGERVRRPAPKVLDADGADTSVGDTVYDVDTGEKMWVCALPEPGAYQCVKLRLINGMFKTLDPCRFTHRAPVLAADGKPLREGETVWTVKDGYEATVTKVGDGFVDFEGKDGGFGTACSPSDQLTHERPESWERLEEDARNIRAAILDSDKLPFEVIDERALDLVRRAKKLAGVSE